MWESSEGGFEFLFAMKLHWLSQWMHLVLIPKHMLFCDLSLKISEGWIFY